MSGNHESGADVGNRSRRLPDGKSFTYAVKAIFGNEKGPRSTDVRTGYLSVAVTAKNSKPADPVASNNTDKASLSLPGASTLRECSSAQPTRIRRFRTGNVEPRRYLRGTEGTQAVVGYYASVADRDAAGPWVAQNLTYDLKGMWTGGFMYTLVSGCIRTGQLHDPVNDGRPNARCLTATTAPSIRRCDRNGEHQHQAEEELAIGRVRDLSRARTSRPLLLFSGIELPAPRTRALDSFHFDVGRSSRPLACVLVRPWTWVRPWTGVRSPCPWPDRPASTTPKKHLAAAAERTPV